MGWIADWQHDDEAARGYAAESLALAAEAGDIGGVARARFALGYIEYRGQNLGAARDHFLAALPTFREIGLSWGTPATLIGLGRTARDEGAVDEAMSLFAEALGRYEEMGWAWGSADALRLLGDCARRTGDLDEARRRLRRSLTIQQELMYRAGAVCCLAGLAAVAWAHREAQRALQLAGAAEALAAACGAEMGIIDRSELDACLALIPVAGRETGRRLCLEEGTALALEGEPQPLSGQLDRTAELAR